MEGLKIIPRDGKKVFFASDFHLGIGTHTKSYELERERKIIRWLDRILPETEALFLLGDIFDFWFEYKHAIPKGHTRFLAALSRFTDSGKPVYLFPGNHDMWMFDYLRDELNLIIYHDPIEIEIGTKNFFLGHGDGLGPGDHFYKVLRRIFRNSLARFLFRWIHPDIGIGFARRWSKNSRISKTGKGEFYRGEDEYLLQYCRKMDKQKSHDFYIFGHRHLPLDIQISEKSRYYNLGEWVKSYTYGEFDGEMFNLRKFEE
jgi:UDP-2,3-diacylglucosamine hydrolase